MSFDENVKKIRELFSQYSVQDVAYSLFTADLWLPNLLSSVQHQLFVAIFSSMKPEGFNKQDQIKEYKDFKKFSQDLYALSPSFPSLEDYIPSFDWGEIKYPLDGKQYKFFYGGIGNMFDLLKGYDMTFMALDEEYETLVGRSPKQELEESLKFQTDIIDAVSAQPSQDSLDKLMPGTTRIASKTFWQQVQSYMKRLNPSAIFSQSFLDTVTMDLGDFPANKLGYEAFGSGVLSGKLIRHYFVKYGDKYYPVSPRLYPIILCDEWGDIFDKHHADIDKEEPKLQRDLMMEVTAFLRGRVSGKSLFPLVSAVEDGDKPHRLVFSAGILTKDRFVAFYNLTPFSTKKQAEDELKQIQPDIKRAYELLSREPLKIASHWKRGFIQFAGKEEDQVLTPEIFVILPQMNSNPQPVVKPKDFPATIVFLDQFIGVLDEIEDANEFGDFLDYLDGHKKQMTVPIVNIVDKFASFRHTGGVLIEGANEPDLIVLDVHWGSNWRFDSLAEFWKAFPPFKLHPDPRTMKVSWEESRVRLVQRTDSRQNLIVINSGNVHGWISSPFFRQKYETAAIANLLMECLEDYFARHKFLGEHPFFETYPEFQVHFFPQQMIDEATKGEFDHLKHLQILKDRFWIADRGFPAPRIPGIRIVIDAEKLAEAFKDVTTNEIEIELLSEVFRQIDGFYPDESTGKILKQLDTLKGQKPRFKSFYVQKEVSFPEGYPPIKPDTFEHKKSRKRIAELALKLDLKPKSYTRDAAKSKLEKLRDEVIEEINEIVRQFNFDKAMPKLLSEVDALINEHQMHKLRLKQSLEHDVDFVREIDYAEEETDFLQEHRNYRYLIEKFVQLRPTGTKRFDEKDLKYLLALVDKLLEIYGASDSIYYEIYPLNVKVTRDFVIQIRYKEDIEAQQKLFSEEKAQLTLGTLGKESDRLDAHENLEDYLDGLDKKFRTDLGFQLKNLVAVLSVMAVWAANADAEEAPFYSADMQKIEEVCRKSVKDFGETDASEIKAILEFLTLESSKVLTIKGQSQLAQDLPVWEHIKRLHRYSIRPLIKIEDQYYWGPHSARQSAIIWMNAAGNGAMPADIDAPNVQKYLRAENEKTEKLLEKRVLEITKRFTAYADRVNYSRGTHPQEIGEYDTLAYIEDKNILLNIESKDISGAYSLKDAKRLKERIFRTDGKNKGNLLKVEEREKYLHDNLDKFRTVLGWPIKDDPKVTSIYVSRNYYWWTKYPPRHTTVNFVRIDLLDDFLKDLI